MSTQPPAVSVVIRPCEEDDVAAITTIYAHHVLHGLASFEISGRARMTWGSGAWMSSAKAFPISSPNAAERWWGYAYVSPYRLRPAYRHTAENSVYLHPSWGGRGIGRQLMSALLAECEARGLRQIGAVIGDSANYASISLHKSLGFREVGVLRAVGFTFGRWVDSLLMQRELGAGDSTPP